MQVIVDVFVGWRIEAPCADDCIVAAVVSVVSVLASLLVAEVLVVPAELADWCIRWWQQLWCIQPVLVWCGWGCPRRGVGDGLAHVVPNCSW